MKKPLYKTCCTILLAAVILSSAVQSSEEADSDAKMEAKYRKEKALAKSAIDTAGKKLEADYEKYGQFTEKVADDYRAISEAYYRYGDLQSSIEYALHALKVEMKLRSEDDPVLAKLYFDTGNKYYMSKQHPTEILYLQKAVDIYNNGTGKGSLALADTYEGIASIYINLEDYKKSLYYNKKTLEIWKKKLSKDDEALQRSIMNQTFLEQEISKKDSSQRPAKN